MTEGRSPRFVEVEGMLQRVLGARYVAKLLWLRHVVLQF